MLEINQKDFIEAVRFALHCAGKRDIRFYLNSVCFDVQGDTLSIVGTDGHRVAVAAFDGLTGLQPGAWAIPRADIEAFLKAVKPDRKQTVQIEFFRATMRVIVGNVLYPLPIVEGHNFPEWRRVQFVPGQVPSVCSLVGLNALYVTAAGRACQRLANGKYGGLKLHTADGARGVCFEVPICKADFDQLSRATVYVAAMRLQGQVK